MNILKIWDADYPWDIRVEKICRALANQGHAVHLLCRNQKNQPVSEPWQYGHIHRLPFLFTYKIASIVSFPAFFNPLWFWLMRHLIAAWNIDIILVRDLPLMLTAAAVGRIASRPVIWDMAENYFFLVKDLWRYEPFHVQNLLVRNPFLVKFVEKVSFRSANQILVVAEESRKRLIDAGVPAQKIAIVSNTPDISSMNSMCDRTDESTERLLRNRYVILYVGGLEVVRGLIQVLDALPFVIEAAPDLLFLIIGHGGCENRLKERVVELGLSKHTHFAGWVDFHDLGPFLRQSHIGIIPHCVTEHTNHTIPNKLFDYMSQGLPVIASDAKPIARILRNERCGLIFNTTHQLAMHLIELRDPCLRRKMGERAREAVLRRYNWGYDSSLLNKVICRLAER